jgi:hypothetical protein
MYPVACIINGAAMIVRNHLVRISARIVSLICTIVMCPQVATSPHNNPHSSRLLTQGILKGGGGVNQYD